MTSETAPFTRQRLTWLAYWMLSYYTFQAAMLGPLLPFLRAELDLNYTLAGLHLSAISFGIILSGLSAERLARAGGRRATLWGGAAGLAAGALALALGRWLPLTLAGVFCMGYFGALVQVMIQAILSDLHGERRTIALTEANIGASLSAALSPLLIGGFLRLGISWRAALFLAMGLLVLIALRFHTESIPNPPAGPGASSRDGRQGQAERPHLPVAYWAYWLVICLSVAIEWCLMIWSPDFLEKVVGLSRVDASTALALFFVATVLGRIAGSRLAWSLPGITILLSAFGICAAGFFLFWLATIPALNLAGLFIAGLGAANLFPLAMAVAISQAPRQANAASARVSFGVGIAGFIAPFSLARIADQAGIYTAYAILPALFVVAVAVTILTHHLVGPARRPRQAG